MTILSTLESGVIYKVRTVITSTLELKYNFSEVAGGLSHPVSYIYWGNRNELLVQTKPGFEPNISCSEV